MSRYQSFGAVPELHHVAEFSYPEPQNKAGHVTNHHAASLPPSSMPMPLTLAIATRMDRDDPPIRRRDTEITDVAVYRVPIDRTNPHRGKQTNDERADRRARCPRKPIDARSKSPNRSRGRTSRRLPVPGSAIRSKSSGDRPTSSRRSRSKGRESTQSRDRIKYKSDERREVHKTRRHQRRDDKQMNQRQDRKQGDQNRGDHNRGDRKITLVPSQRDRNQRKAERERARRAVPTRKRRSKPSRPKGPRPASAKRYIESFENLKGVNGDNGDSNDPKLRRRRTAAVPTRFRWEPPTEEQPQRQHSLQQLDESESDTFKATNVFAGSGRANALKRELKLQGRRRTEIYRYAPRMTYKDVQRRHSANHSNSLRIQRQQRGGVPILPPSLLYPEQYGHNGIAMERIEDVDDDEDGSNGLCPNGLYPKRRSIKMDTPRPCRASGGPSNLTSNLRRSLTCGPLRCPNQRGNGRGMSLPVAPLVVPMLSAGEEHGLQPKGKREIMHSQNQIQYTIRARYERSILVIRVCHMVSRRVFRNEFTQSDFPNKSIYVIAKTLIDGISKSTPISVHEYGLWCYLSLSGADIPSFALRPVREADGGRIGSLV